MAQLRHAKEVALCLGKMRGERGATQRQLAERLAVSQANISRIEHEEDIFLSTLREYVEALGGELRIQAAFPDQIVDLLPEQTAAPIPAEIGAVS
jgi:transcriptional regulator with XRE-family HTH domain